MDDEKRRLYRCPVCDTVVEVLDRVGMELVCCGPAMIPLQASTDHAESIRHLPILRQKDDGLTVAVSSRRHAMDCEHYIKWIEIAFGSKCLRHFLKPGQRPRATFEIVPTARVVIVRAYCNVHGLWEVSEKVQLPAFRGALDRRERAERDARIAVREIPPQGGATVRSIRALG